MVEVLSPDRHLVQDRYRVVDIGQCVDPRQALFRPAGANIRRRLPEYGTPAHVAPIVDLRESRAAALAAYELVKNTNPRP